MMRPVPPEADKKANFWDAMPSIKLPKLRADAAAFVPADCSSGRPSSSGSSLSASSSASSLLASALPATPPEVGSTMFATSKHSFTNSPSAFILQQKTQGLMFPPSSTSCVDPAGASVLDSLAFTNPPPPNYASANEPQGQSTYASITAPAEHATVAERDRSSLASGIRGGVKTAGVSSGKAAEKVATASFAGAFDRTELTYEKQPATRNFTAKDINRAIRDDLIQPRFEGEHLNATHFKDSEICRHFAGLSYAAAGLVMQLVPRRAGMIYHPGHKMEALLQSQLTSVIKNHCNMA
ncbi:MAG: hypothetical protein WDW38_003937 [Sanguina aurantia]